jgi:hypothetical protein
MIKFIYTIPFIFLILACSAKRYDLVIYNKSNEVINNVTVWYGSHPIPNGTLSPEVDVSILDYGVDLKNEMKITWKDSGNKQHEQTFKTFDFIPKDYAGGNVIFLYEGNDKFIFKYFKPTINYPKLIE